MIDSVSSATKWRTRLLALILLLQALTFGCGSGLLLDERFQDARLLDWTIIDETETIEGPSIWRVEQDGWLHQRSNIWGRRGDFLNRWHGTIITAGDERWDDYRLFVRARPTDDDGFGIIVRLKDKEHFYRLLFIQDGMNGGPVTRLDRRDGADYTELWSAPRGYRAGSEMLIQVEVKGDTIRSQVDGSALFEIRDGAYRQGKIGLFCFAQEGQAFDDVKVIRQ
jgi:hypothetical protein